jgi:hypothetical protein
MYSLGCDCEQCGQKFTAVSHFIHPIKKLPLYCTQRDVGTESDCGVDGGVPTVAGDLSILMDPVTFLLLFNVMVWLYWTVK